MLGKLRELVAPERLALVIFDLDGTLVDSVKDLKLALDKMYDDLSMAHATELQVRCWVGNGAEMLVRRALGYTMSGDGIAAKIFEEGYRRFIYHYRHTSGLASACYGGAVDLFAVLREAQVKIAIATNKPEDFTLPLLAKMGLHADLVVSGDSLPAKKPDPMQLSYCLTHFSLESHHAVMVGDSSNDLLAAQALNMKNVAVSYGYNHGVSISNYQPDLLVDSLTELR